MFEAMPQSRSTIPTTVSRLSRARSRAVMTQRSSRKATRLSAGWRVEAAQHSARCCPNAKSAGASGSPCSQPSPWATSLQRPFASHPQYVDEMCCQKTGVRKGAGSTVPRAQVTAESQGCPCCPEAHPGAGGPNTRSRFPSKTPQNLQLQTTTAPSYYTDLSAENIDKGPRGTGACSNALVTIRVAGLTVVAATVCREPLGFGPSVVQPCV